MAGALDMLFSGTPPTQVTNTGQNTTNVPTWLQDYAQGILSQGAALASQPYAQFPGPMVSGMTPYQTQAGATVAGLQGAYQPTLTQAINAATSSMAPTQAMMNPYTQNVIQKAEDTATQYWQNQLMPSITNQFTAAGQPMSSGDIGALGQAGKQVTQNIQDTANAALTQAYQNAQQAALAGSSALGSLAQTGQGLGLQGASALDVAGQELQANQQANLNAAYQQFQQQQQWPYQQAGWLQGLMAGTIPGTTPGGTTTQQQTIPWQQGPGTTQIGNILQSLGTATQPFAARGGRIKRVGGLGSLMRD
jgi:hypothetical protein